MATSSDSYDAKQWTVEEFHSSPAVHRIRSRRPILLHGELLERGSVSPPLSCAIQLAADELRRVIPPTMFVRPQLPLPLSLDTDPVPDVAIVAGRPRDYFQNHPSGAFLVVEIRESGLAVDPMDKVKFYAKAGIAESWIVDLNTQQLHVFRVPLPSAVEWPTSEYYTVFSLDATASISPLAIPGVSINVSELLPDHQDTTAALYCIG